MAEKRLKLQRIDLTHKRPGHRRDIEYYGRIMGTGIDFLCEERLFRWLEVFGKVPRDGGEGRWQTQDE